MLSMDEIEILVLKDELTSEEGQTILADLLYYMRLNEQQGKLLAQCLGELDRLKSRVDFYRSITIKKV